MTIPTATLPHREPDGWLVEIVGLEETRHGPSATEAAAHAAELELFQRWRTAAKERGGWAWKATAMRWVITVPEGVAVRGTLMRDGACARHT